MYKMYGGFDGMLALTVGSDYPLSVHALVADTCRAETMTITPFHRVPPSLLITKGGT